MIIFLVGPRGSGKTTVGRMLAGRLSLAFMDTDALVAEGAGQSIAEIVEAEGWPGFRLRESLALAAAAVSGTVVATGGGMVLSEANRAFMRLHGRVIYLHAPARVLRDRLMRRPEAGQRPSLTGENPADETAAVLAERDPLYRAAAHHTVEAVASPREVVENISDMLAGNFFA